MAGTDTAGLLSRLPLHVALPPGTPPMRLDAALAISLPGTGLRARRRLWDWCRVRVNDQPRRPGHIVKAGDSIHLEPSDTGPRPLQENGGGVHLAALGAQYAALFKPDGLHSAAIAGSPHESLEGTIAALWPELLAEWFSRNQEREYPGGIAGLLSAQPILLTRLDHGTSGLILAALTPTAANRFRQLEPQGQVRKTYLALLRGALAEPVTARRRLDTTDRAETLVLPEDDPDPVRRTFAEPLCLTAAPQEMSQGDGAPFQSECTLARITILRGARHQIRAHLAAAGHPLLGENLYAPAVSPNAGARLYLHHARLALPGFTAQCPPPWPLALPMEQALMD